MENLESKIIKRVESIDTNTFQKIIENLKKYNLNYYDNFGNFSFNQFRRDCMFTTEILFKNDTPHPSTGIRYQLCDFLSLIYTIVGVRNMTEFMK